MLKLQRKVSSLLESNIIKPEDNIGKIALLFGDKWGYWKEELQSFDFSMKDTIEELLLVEDWDD